jgi:hypothetical protein
MRTTATTSRGNGEQRLRDHGDDDDIFLILFFFIFFFPCGWYNLTARDNRLFRADEPPAGEKIDFCRHPGADGRDLRTEKYIM